jgi:hypothetical protein
VLLFDRTRALSPHLFEHVHGEGRDRGQAMVDLKALYEQHGLAMTSNDLPDHLPLFLEFLSETAEAEAQDLIEQTSHVLEAIRLRLEKRKVSYASVFACIQVLAHAKPQDSVVTALMGGSDPVLPPPRLSAARMALLPSCGRRAARAQHASADAKASCRHLQPIEPGLRGRHTRHHQSYRVRLVSLPVPHRVAAL